MPIPSHPISWNTPLLGVYLGVWMLQASNYGPGYSQLMPLSDVTIRKAKP
jgi:hypothetical protein